MRNDVLKLIYKCLEDTDNKFRKILAQDSRTARESLFRTHWMTFVKDKKQMWFKIEFSNEPPINVLTFKRDAFFYTPYCEISCGKLKFELSDSEYKALYQLVKEFDEKRLAEILANDLKIVEEETAKRLAHYERNK